MYNSIDGRVIRLWTRCVGRLGVRPPVPVQVVALREAFGAGGTGERPVVAVRVALVPVQGAGAAEARRTLVAGQRFGQTVQLPVRLQLLRPAELGAALGARVPLALLLRLVGRQNGFLLLLVCVFRGLLELR